MSCGYRSSNASCSRADRVHVLDPHVERRLVVEELPAGVACGSLETGSQLCQFSRGLRRGT
jgi:hypothetical protein